MRGVPGRVVLAVLLGSALSSGALGAIELVSAGKAVVLRKPAGQLDEVVVRDGGAFLVRDSNYRRQATQALELYDASGRRIRKLGGFGRSPGSFYRLRDIAATSDGVVWAADVIGRLSFFDPRGRLLGTKLIQNPGFQVDGLAIDEARGFFYLGGCLPTAGFLDRGCLLVHQYRLPGRVYVRSFLPTDPEILAKNQVALQDVALALDDRGRLFVVDAPALRLHRIDPRTGATKTFRVHSRRARPVPALAATSEAALRAYEDSDLLERILVSGKHVVVAIRRAEARGFLAVFHVEGEQVGIDVPPPGHLVGKTRDGLLLFSKPVRGGFELRRYALRGDRAPAGAPPGGR